MPKIGRGPKPTRGQINTDKSERKSHFGPSFASRKSKQTQNHHVGTIHLGSGSSGSGVTQSIKEKKGTIGMHNQPY